MKDNLLQLFMERKDGFVSGEQISRLLNCSRTAVWKKVQALRKEGYSFEAVPRLGYRLVSCPSRLDALAIMTRLTTRTFGRQLKVCDEVDSTQNVALEWVKEGAREGALVLAELQTAGRGRMGRKWHSPKGKGIWMSLVLKPHVELPFLPQLTLLAAVALCRAIRQTAQVEAGIKWPNDILIKGRKVSGILLESSAEDERVRHVVAGIGISANLAADDYPAELQDKATSLLIEGGTEIDRVELISAVLAQLEELYDLYRREGFQPVRMLWEALSVTLRQQVRIQTPAGVVQGIAQGIDELGALDVTKPTGESVKVYSGDVFQPA